MTHANESTSQPSQTSLATRMIIGGVIGVLVASYFFFSVDSPDPAWGKFWMIRPYLVMTFAGAMGGLCNHFILQYRWVAGINKPIAILISAVVAIVGMFMGIVLGLDGTLWN
jgi:hypothetical protein